MWISRPAQLLKQACYNHHTQPDDFNEWFNATIAPHITDDAVEAAFTEAFIKRFPQASEVAFILLEWMRLLQGQHLSVPQIVKA